LEGPQSCSLPLTTAERAFLLYLTKQPEMRASYADLIRSVDPQSCDLPVRVSQARLGVLVSRLRRKLQNRHGLELPVKALHKWGYM
ncbi:helix-turn-helix domain-containing protein, partial [Klebsiella pneumoniae]|nr:helix-turn-helix domain-containing protein [Klebsiella pneumoniae]